MITKITDESPFVRVRKKLITRQALESKIADDDEFITCLVTLLYEHQTPDEQQHGRTRHKNGIGLSASTHHSTRVCMEGLL